MKMITPVILSHTIDLSVVFRSATADSASRCFLCLEERGVYISLMEDAVV